MGSQHNQYRELGKGLQVSGGGKGLAVIDGFQDLVIADDGKLHGERGHLKVAATNACVKKAQGI